MRAGRIGAVAELCGVSVSSIRLWARTTDFPKSFKTVGVALWDLDEVTNWLVDKKESQHGSSREAEDEHH